MTPKKILILRLSSIGDILLTSPFIRQARKGFPEAQIDFAVKSVFKELVAYNPNINTVYEIKPERGRAGLRDLNRVFKNQTYDFVFDLHNNFRTKMLSAGLNKTVIHKDRLKRALLVYLKKNTYREIIPIPQRYLYTAKNAGVQDDGGGLELFWPKGVEEKANQILAERHINTDFIALAPGAAHATKRWPAEYFKELVHNLNNDFKGKIVLLGSAAEQAELNELVSSARVINFAGNLSLLESAAVLKRANLLVTNDSGLMHMASAVKTPAIALFGSTVKEFGFFPYRSDAIILEDNTINCRPCSHIGRESCPKGHFDCMRKISPQMVLKEIETKIAE